jgi:hypothetical protein
LIEMTGVRSEGMYVCLKRMKIVYSEDLRICPYNVSFRVRNHDEGEYSKSICRYHGNLSPEQGYGESPLNNSFFR